MSSVSCVRCFTVSVCPVDTVRFVNSVYSGPLGTKCCRPSCQVVPQWISVPAVWHCCPEASISGQDPEAPAFQRCSVVFSGVAALCRTATLPRGTQLDRDNATGMLEYYYHYHFAPFESRLLVKNVTQGRNSLVPLSPFLPCVFYFVLSYYYRSGRVHCRVTGMHGLCNARTVKCLAYIQAAAFLLHSVTQR